MEEPQRAKENSANLAPNKKAGTQTSVPALVLAGCPDKTEVSMGQGFKLAKWEADTDDIETLKR
jgi:hypothetical protein